MPIQNEIIELNTIVRYVEFLHWYRILYANKDFFNVKTGALYSLLSDKGDVDKDKYMAYAAKFRNDKLLSAKVVNIRVLFHGSDNRDYYSKTYNISITDAVSLIVDYAIGDQKISASMIICKFKENWKIINHIVSF